MSNINSPSGLPLKLPVIAPKISELLGPLSDEQIDFADLSRTLERFPSIAARIICLANSAWVGSNKPLTSLNEACKRLGLTIVKRTSIALAISSPFRVNRCPAFKANLYWEKALMVAEAAFEVDKIISKKTPHSSVDTETIRTAGLLHNLGFLWLADALPAETTEAINCSKSTENLSINDALRMKCGVSYSDASGILAEAFQLPHPLQIILKEQSNQEYAGQLSDSVHTLITAKQLTKAITTEKDDYFYAQSGAIDQQLTQTEWKQIVQKLELKYETLQGIAKLMLIN